MASTELNNALSLLQNKIYVPNMFATSVSSKIKLQDEEGSWVTQERTKLINNASLDIQTTGIDQDITALTAIKQRIVEQKFYTLSISDYVPITVGQSAWEDFMLTYRAYDIAAPFTDGDVDTATHSRIPTVDIVADSVITPFKTWNFEMGYSLPELMQIRSHGKFDLIERRERALKRRWDLGIQEIAFLGHPKDKRINGLLSLDEQGVVIDTTTIPANLGTITPEQFNTILGIIFGKLPIASNGVIRPNRFLVPLKIWFQLATFVSSIYPGIDKIDALQRVFRKLSLDETAEILPCIYCDSEVNGLGVDRFVMYRYDQDIIEMNIPVDYTTAGIGTYNNYQFHSVAYGRYGGVQLLNPKGVMYFDAPPSTPPNNFRNKFEEEKQKLVITK